MKIKQKITPDTVNTISRFDNVSEPEAAGDNVMVVTVRAVTMPRSSC